MNTATVAALNLVNQKFYAKVAGDFSSSREYAWSGWEGIWESLTPKPKSILDLGCGNGRFYEFLQKQNIDFDYFGIDASTELLNIAREKYPLAQFRQSDLLNFQSSTVEVAEKYDLITIFGVMHHIPGHNNRARLLKQAKALLSPDGHIAVSFWNFLEDGRLAKKIADWNVAIADGHIAAFDLNELEENDYLLDWQRGETAYRYCHFADQEEIVRLVAEAGLESELNFSAEGRSEQLNSYYLLRTA